MNGLNSFSKFRVKPGGSAASTDNTILSQWQRKKITTSECIGKIERNNNCKFDSEDHFVCWAKSIGWKRGEWV